MNINYLYRPDDGVLIKLLAIVGVILTIKNINIR